MAAAAEAEARPPETTPASPEQLLIDPELKLFELVDGRLVEKEMGAESSWIGGQMVEQLGAFVRKHQLGWVFPADTGFQCFPRDPGRVRKPDVSFVRADRLKAPPRGGHITVHPDLAIEVVSPNDRYYDVHDKVQEYVGAGAPLVWVIDPISRIVHVYRIDKSRETLIEGAELSGEDVVPGFTCRVADLFLPLEVSE